MPNEPLQTYRAVDPVGYHFGSTATTASQPFVLAHNYLNLNATAATGTVTPTVSTNTSSTGTGWQDASPGNMILNPDRCLPWLARNFEGIYPVAVPNAYDRILIFPMYTIEGQGATIVVQGGSGFDAPAVIPYGLLPETRGFSETNKLNPKIARFPEDLIAALGPPTGSTGHGINLRTNGAWMPLHPYGSNFLASNQGVDNSYTGTSPSAFARDPVPSLGLGYRLPSDVSISKSGTSGMSAAFVDHAAGNVIVGAGIEYNTLGAEEIVAVPVTHPSTLTWAAPSGTAFRVHWFLMGVFLG